MKRLSLWLIPLILVAGLSLFVGCSDDDDSPTGPTDTATITVTAPASGARLLYNSTVTVLWTAENVTSFDIGLSLNDGATWSAIATAVSGNSHQWLVPATASATGKIRVTRSGDAGVFGVSGTFTIAAAAAEFETMAAWGDSLLNPTKNITAEALWAEMNDGDPTQPYIISVRSLADDTVRGHIPGAHHWDAADLVNFRNELPADKKIVVYCYTGQTASFSTSYLNLTGFNAYNLKWGFCSWTSDTAQTGAGGGWYTLTPGGQALETTNNPLTAEYGFPHPTVTGATASEMFINRISLQLTASPTSWKMKSAAEVFANRNDGDPNNDWFLLCYWPEANYNAGHIPGSFRFNPGSLGVSENLKYIPTDRPVIVYCFTGQTSMQMDAYLNALGYDAYSMRMGMNAVTDNPAVLNPNLWVDLTPSYPVETGPIQIRG
ncbi:hypothetical protein KKH27_00135 [bacterium]|nr:hypothetical protein [bacterium]